ncbi:MAG: TVP38/TMEM64 family protein [Proteobacteria bacterium]|nr:TVP38/TMEM64 family protein [Pseudomonadota bacterium]
MNTKRIKQIVILTALIALVALFFIFDLKQYLTLEYIKSQQQAFADYYSENTVLTIAIYFVIYVITTALSLPGAAVLTLVGGALFGLVTGTIVVSFASTLGATLAFLVSRFLLGDYVQNKFSDKLKVINQGIEKEGEFYLFTLRLVPLFPFFLINLVMGLTPIRTFKFFIVSQLGMLPGTIVYVFAGTQLAQIDSLQGILSPGLIGAFVLLGIFPLLAKKTLELIKRRRVSTT